LLSSNYEDTSTSTKLIEKTSLTGAEMSLNQINSTYPCLAAFIKTEPWLKQPKMMHSPIAVECQKKDDSTNIKLLQRELS